MSGECACSLIQVGTGKPQFNHALATTDRVRHLLLLTATPHNGYSDTFASLLRMLDVDVVSGPLHAPHIHRAIAARRVCQRRRLDVETWFAADAGRSPFPRCDQDEVIVAPSAYEKEAIDAVMTYGEQVLAHARSGTIQPHHRTAAYGRCLGAFSAVSQGDESPTTNEHYERTRR